MVRLQQRRASFLSPHLLSFNPTMVRLQRRMNEYIKEKRKRFQSHYGAIATCIRSDESKKLERLSIPLWCDCNRDENYSFNVTYTFQSHYGAIATPIPNITSSRKHNLSIPLWCDCNEMPRVVTTIAEVAFNPTMVRLQRVCCWTRGGWLKRFQSHYGAIATYPRNLEEGYDAILSIPLWCDCNSVSKR